LHRLQRVRLSLALNFYFPVFAFAFAVSMTSGLREAIALTATASAIIDDRCKKRRMS